MSDVDDALTKLEARVTARDDEASVPAVRRSFRRMSTADAVPDVEAVEEDTQPQRAITVVEGE